MGKCQIGTTITSPAGFRYFITTVNCFEPIQNVDYTCSTYIVYKIFWTEKICLPKITAKAAVL